MVPESTGMGRYVRQSQGFKAFIPNLLPPDPPIAIDRGCFSISPVPTRRLPGLMGYP